MIRHACVISATAILSGGHGALAQDAKAEIVRLCQRDEAIVVEVENVEGEAVEYEVEVIELMDSDRVVTGVLQMIGEGEVVVVPPEPQAPSVTIGVSIEPVPLALASQLSLEAGSAVMVAAVTQGLAADIAGIQVYDVITSFGGQNAVTQESLKSHIATVKPGDAIHVGVVRAGKPMALEVVAQPYVARARTDLVLDALVTQRSMDLTLTPSMSVTELSMPLLLYRDQVELSYETFELEREGEACIQAQLEEIKRAVAEIEVMLRDVED